MNPKRISYPLGPQGWYTQWVKAVNPAVVLKHKQCQDMTTSEPGTLNSEAAQPIYKVDSDKSPITQYSVIGKYLHLV